VRQVLHPVLHPVRHPEEDDKPREQMRVRGSRTSLFVRRRADSEFFVSDVDEPGKIGLDKQNGRILVPLIASNALLIAPLPSQARLAEK